MVRPRKMKRMELTVHKNDADSVIEYLGRREIMQFSDPDPALAQIDKPPPGEKENGPDISRRLEQLRDCADFLGVALPPQPDSGHSRAAAETDALCEKLCATVEALKKRYLAAVQEQRRVEDTLNEAKAFSNLNAPFSDLDQLSYLSLRLGRLDPREQPKLKEQLGQRAVIIPLDSDGERILAVTSRKGRFALDSELSNHAFEPIAIPEGYQGIPAEMIDGLQRRLVAASASTAEVSGEKERMAAALADELRHLAAACRLSLAIEQVKSHFSVTSTIYMLSGWVPADAVAGIVRDISRISENRVAIRAYNPGEVPRVRDGAEKVPVSLKHGPVVKGFEVMVFSYGAPPYGTIDPTALVAFFYTLLFGIMFGDVGHGFVLLLLGLLSSKRGPLKRFVKFSTPLIAVSVSSMIMGLLVGSVFTDEELLVGPTKLISGAITGHPVDRILHILPMESKGGSVTKLFYLFGFTVGIGVIINSLGLIINIVNCISQKRYEELFFSKIGIAGLAFFWYALSIGIRCVMGGRFEWFDIIGLSIPCVFIFFGHILWRAIAGKKPALEGNLPEFIMEGVMEVWETATSYFSNTTSFLRVGAFALSHAVLAYIVFYFTELLIFHTGGLNGWFWGVFIMLIGNAIIIVLEGLVVAIQVVRLQYYEFFGKFFNDRGAEFAPFRFTNIN